MDTILFIDEIHRFNKGQQDALLGAVEDGTVTLIGATTENPGFEVNGALLSRCQLILFAPLSKDDLRTLVYSALRDHPRGLQLKDVEIEDSVVDKLIAQSEGDARFLLNQIEWIGNSLGDRKKIDEKLLEEFQYKKPLRYDKSGEEHYNLISALHKSVRGSDPDAALYWLHRMIQGGEDPRFILRRLMRMSMEDIGLADPNALLLATSAREAYDFMGIPEGLIALDELAIYLSLAPKSNSVELAGMAADSIIKQTGTLPRAARLPQFRDPRGQAARLRQRLPVRPRQPRCLFRTGTLAQTTDWHRNLPPQALRQRKATRRTPCTAKANPQGKKRIGKVKRVGKAGPFLD
jgi:ATPase related to the helicase subunit of the Holliday junction resolvase